MDDQNLKSLLTFGVRKGASDIHLEAGYPPSYRIRGRIFGANVEPLTSADTLAICRLVAGDSGALGEDEADCSYSIANVSRFRATMFKQRGSWGMVLRVIPFEIPAIEKLRLPPATHRLVDARQGLILVTGATGQGKSTTIASLLTQLSAAEPLHIVTIEQPIEFLFPKSRSLFVQREVGSDTRSFSSAMRAVLRMDPDVIMVGELRDRETAETCLMASETGHLVISTLHTPDVMRSIHRFVGLFAPDEQAIARTRFADAIRGILSLRLVPTLDGQGVIPACELLFATHSIQEAIRDPEKLQQIPGLLERGHGDLGSQTFDRHLVALCERKLINPETAKSYATSRSAIERYLAFESGAAP